jgi:uncharacterized membrane protein
MFQTHCYDAWLGGAARNSKFAMWSQLGGTFPAPLFLFLAGISFVLVVDKLLAKSLAAGQIAKTTIRRGAEIFGLGLLFRIQEYAISLGWAPWSDLFRVDILNTIGLSIMLMGVVCWTVLRMRGVAPALQSRSGGPGSSANSGAGVDGRPYTASGGAGVDGRPYTNPEATPHDVSAAARSRRDLVIAALLVAAAMAAITPLLWTTWRPHFLPWELETYINGVHNLGQPQPWLFPIFPWIAFAFVGLAFGFILFSESASKLGTRFFIAAGLAGMTIIYLAKFLDSRSLQIYPVFDFWHTSPEFFMMRVGLLLLLTVVAYAWCRWGPGQWGFSPMIQLGKTSLLVYWVHIEFVYGKFSILPRQSQSVIGASRGLLIIFLAMLVLSLLRTKLRGRFTQFPIWNRSRVRAI